MNFDDLVAILKRVNAGRPNPVDDALLQRVVALVMKNPLDEDRADCQAQIAMVISQFVGGMSNARAED